MTTKGYYWEYDLGVKGQGQIVKWSVLWLVVEILTFSCLCLVQWCADANEGFILPIFLVWFDSLLPSQQLWSCRDGQFTKPHFFPGQALVSNQPVSRAHTFTCYR